MKYLIDKEVLNNRLAFFTVPTDIWEAIQHTPIEDAVPVVRCKDCRYWQDNNGGKQHNYCKWRLDETPDEDDFCSLGDWKDGEANENH